MTEREAIFQEGIRIGVARAEERQRQRMNVLKIAFKMLREGQPIEDIMTFVQNVGAPQQDINIVMTEFQETMTTVRYFTSK